MTLFLVLSFNVDAMAQGISQEELNKKIAEAKQKMGQGDKSNDEFMKQMMQSNAGAQAMPKASSTLKIPPLNAVAMSKLPKHIFTTTELDEHIGAIIQKLQKVMKSEQLKSVEEVIEKCENDSLKMGNTGVLVFYKGAEKEGVYLAAYAAKRNVIDTVNVGNLAGLLTVSNESVLAIPILKFLLKKQPKNTIVLNNLGQAFIKLGAIDSAQVYLNKCLKQDARFARANTTAALIAKQQGKTAKAIELVTESLKYESSEAAELLAEQLGVKMKPDFTATTKGTPDYFDLYKFKLPKIQRTTDEYMEVVSEQKSYLEGLNELESELTDLYASERDKGADESEITKIKSINAIHPITARAMKMLMAEYTAPDNMTYLVKVKGDYEMYLNEQRQALEADLALLSKTYEKQLKDLYDQMGEGGGNVSEKIKNLKLAFCKQENKRKDEYLYKCASATEAHNKAILHFAREQFHFQSKWHYLAGLNEHLANAAYYQAALIYVGHLKSIYKFATAEDSCSQDTIAINKVKINNPFERICPIDISVSIGLGELKMNCKNAALGLNLIGIKAKYTENFVSKESTIEIGVGTPPVVKGNGLVAVSGEMSAVFYITVNSKGEISDWGMKQTIEGAASIGVGEMSVGSEFSLTANYGVISGFNASPSVPAGLFTMN
ncbi:tetratricopeptide repeat protein [Gelidibacter algens]|uniref:tetratricopeptide repeat protein n=1 Tax=Gelidibacter algens TaxID=49280 RepID=UPI0011B93BAE|nr:hypothetical protein [Gelidibacter algens]